MGGPTLLGLLLLDAEDVGVVGAVVVAGEEVAVLLAEARVVVEGTAVDLGLLRGNAGVEDTSQQQTGSVLERCEKGGGSDGLDGRRERERGN